MFRVTLTTFSFNRTHLHVTMANYPSYVYTKVQMKCFFIVEFERAAKIKKIVIYRFLISLLDPKL